MRSGTSILEKKIHDPLNNKNSLKFSLFGNSWFGRTKFRHVTSLCVSEVGQVRRSRWNRVYSSHPGIYSRHHFGGGEDIVSEVSVRINAGPTRSKI